MGLAFPLIAQLRNLDEAEFLRRARRQAHGGYELVGAYLNDALVGVMGMRPVHPWPVALRGRSGGGRGRARQRRGTCADGLRRSGRARAAK